MSNNNYWSGARIHWRNIPIETISPSTFNELKLSSCTLIDDGEKSWVTPPAAMSQYVNNTYYRVLSEAHNVFYAVTRKNTGTEEAPNYTYTPHLYSVYINNENKNSGCSGSVAYRELSKRFKALYHTSLAAAFGNSKELVTCIPKPLNFGDIDPDVRFPFYKADISSAYASEAAKPLPTMIGAKVENEAKSPTIDYPFAFYPSTHSLAIYGEFEGEASSPTYLLPASPYSLKPIMEDYYAAKESATGNQRQLYKDYMNLFVGYCHRTTNPTGAAIAAVIKARCNHRMEVLREKLENEGNDVVLINTDAIGWVGKDDPSIYTTEKGLGNLILEYHQAEVLVLGSKKYQIKDQKGSVKTIWAGVPREVSDKLSFGDILTHPAKQIASEFDPTITQYRFWEVDSCGRKIREIETIEAPNKEV